MPPLPSLRVGAIRELEDQLRYAPREALLRDMARAELLALEIEADVLYAEDEVIERITGYRPRLEEPATLVGDAVLWDLSALVERLGSLASLREDEVEGSRLTSAEVARRWGVSGKTLERYRRRGLVARRVLDEKRRSRLVFRLSVVEAFEGRWGGRIAAAGRFERLDEESSARLVARARALRAGGASLHGAAVVLAGEFGRSVEGVRQALRRHDALGGGDPVFCERGPVSVREREAWWRGWRRGIEPAVMARRDGRGAAAVRRGIGVARAQRLASIAGSLPRSVDARRGAARVGSWAWRPAPGHVLELLEVVAQIEPVSAREEGAWAGAMRAGLSRASSLIERMDPSAPQASALDEIECELRTALRLKAMLGWSQLPNVVRTLEGRIGRSILLVRGGLAAAGLTGAIGAMLAALEEHDASRGGRLASPVGLGVDRYARQWLRDSGLDAEDRASRASARLGSDAEMVPFTSRLAVWQGWVDMDHRCWGVLSRMDGPARGLLERRYGVYGPSERMGALIEEGVVTRVGAGRVEARALREALRLARGGALGSEG